MRRGKHKIDPNLLDHLRAELRSTYPDLHLYQDNGHILIRGSFPVAHEGAILDRYSIEIERPESYPESIPIVREIGGLIPRTADYHMNAQGEACLFLPDECWRFFPPGTSLVPFLDGPVRNFFLGQSLVRRGQPWPFGQWGHGPQGIYEFYTELLGTNDLVTIRRYLEYLTKENVKGHWSCPCGSGQRLRNCHLNEVRDLRAKIPRSAAIQSWKSLRALRHPINSHIPPKAEPESQEVNCTFQ